MGHPQTAKNKGRERSRPVILKTGINFKCPQCAGLLKYDIGDQKLSCEQCGSKFPVGTIPDPSANENTAHPAEMDTVEYHCPSCGASLHTTSTGLTACCSFCGSDVVLKERMNRMRRPDRIVPFSLTRRECELLYRERLKDALLVPGNMKKKESIAQFMPVYIPFWCLSGTGEGTTRSTETEAVTKGNTIIYNTYSMVQKATVTVSGLYYDACSQFDDETAQWLAFNGERSVPFHPAYLSGVYAEAPDVEYKLIEGLTRDYAESSGNTKQAFTLPDNYTETAELVLMPVWLLSCRQGEKIVYTAVKGINDKPKIRCDLPVSPKRFITLLCLLAALITVLILWMRHFILLRPQITAALSCILAALCWKETVPFLAKVHQWKKDGDPTRRMFREAKKLQGRELLDHFTAREQQVREKKRQRELMREFMRSMWPFLLFLAAFLFVLLVTTGHFIRNPLRLINFFVSDQSPLPAVLCVVSAVMMFFIRCGSSELSLFDSCCMIAQTAICILLAFSGRNKTLLYCLGLISYAITLLVLLNAFRKYNDYVTRPVPFFNNKGEVR